MATQLQTDVTKRPPDAAERLVMRTRPEGSPVMHQSWDKLLFLNWEVPIHVLRPLIPEALEIDTFDGKAWLTITPLHIYDLRPSILPPVPYLSWVHELNVRTYVYVDGVPGVWFFSLDANGLLAVLGARTLFHLPYYMARIELEANNNTVSFSSYRPDVDARFNAQWSIGNSLPPAEPGSLEFFLVERYCLYAQRGDSIFRCRIHHEPWPLQECIGLKDFSSTMATVNGIPEPGSGPLTYCGGPVHVDVWPLEKVR